MGNIRVFFLRDAQRFPVACVASELVDNTVFYAVSTHNPKDKFSRAFARKVALERLAMIGNTKRSTRVVDAVRMEKGVKKAICLEIVQKVKWLEGRKETIPFFPQRTREAAQEWLNAHIHGAEGSAEFDEPIPPTE